MSHAIKDETRRESLGYDHSYHVYSLSYITHLAASVKEVVHQKWKCLHLLMSVPKKYDLLCFTVEHKG